MITRVVVDRKILASCEKRLCSFYPKEAAEQIWGYTRYSRAVICHLEPADVIRSDRDSVDFSFDQDCGTKHRKLVLLGSCHSHPNADPIPSDNDLISAREDKEIIFGICSIQKRSGRKFFSWKFYDIDGQDLELIISEGE